MSQRLTNITDNGNLMVTREGVVSRNVGEYLVSEFAHNVFKYVRKGHVKTDEHWTRNWKRAPLVWEFNNEKEE